MALKIPNYPPIEMTGDVEAQAHLDWLKDLVDILEVMQWLLCRTIGIAGDDEAGVVAYGSVGSDSLLVTATSPESMQITVGLGAGFVDAVPFRKAAAETSAAMVAPVSDPRTDTVSVNATTGLLRIQTGAEAAVPVAPSVSTGYLKLAEIHHVVGETAIYDSATSGEGYIEDCRTILNP